jgi:hypothetical protein
VQQNFCVDPPVIRGENVDHTTGSAHPRSGVPGWFALWRS